MCTNKLFLLFPLLLFSFFARFVTSCSENKEPINKGEAELRLYWIGDNYPEDAAYMRNECNTRIITLHYILINNTGKTIFLPIVASSISPDSVFCSKIQLLIDGKNVETIFYPDNRWNGGVINPYDSIRAQIMIPERLLDSINISKFTSSRILLPKIRIEYQKCQSDTLISKMPIADLKFSKNDSIEFVFADRIGGK